MNVSNAISKKVDSSQTYSSISVSLLTRVRTQDVAIEGLCGIPATVTRVLI